MTLAYIILSWMLIIQMKTVALLKFTIKEENICATHCPDDSMFVCNTPNCVDKIYFRRILHCS